MSEELVAKQVQILAETQQVSLNRMDQQYRFMEETIAELAKLMEETTVLNEALKKSLSEADQGIDDLAKVTAALLTQLKADQQQHGQSAS